MSSNKSDTSSNVSQLTDLSVLSNADVLRHIFGEVHGHREEARKDMQDLKETMNKGLADLTKILSDSIASNNTLFVRMSERLVTVEEDTSYLRVKLAEIQTDSSCGLAEFRRETAEGVADGRKTRLQLQQFQDHLDQKTGALVDKLSESAVKNAAEAAAHAVTEAIARMSVHADDDDDEDEDEDEEDGGVGHNEAVGKGHK